MLYEDIIFPYTVDFNSIIVVLKLSDKGVEFSNKSLETIVIYLEEEYCKGITIEGDLFNETNLKDVHDLIQTLRAIFGSSKEIRLNTNVSMADIAAMKNSLADEIIRYADSV